MGGEEGEKGGKEKISQQKHDESYLIHPVEFCFKYARTIISRPDSCEHIVFIGSPVRCRKSDFEHKGIDSTRSISRQLWQVSLDLPCMSYRQSISMKMNCSPVAANELG